MGYRALLKDYLRHLTLVAGTTFLDEEPDPGVLNKRALAELRLLTAEIERDAYRSAQGPDDGLSSTDQPA